MNEPPVSVRLDHPTEAGQVAIWDQHEAEAIERIRRSRAYFLVTIPDGEDKMLPVAASRDSSPLEMLDLLHAAREAAANMGCGLVVEVLSDGEAAAAEDA